MGRWARPGHRRLRRWWPDRNPLRRRWDRAEAAIAAGLIAVLLAGAPLAAVFAGQWAYHSSVRAQRAGQAGLRQVNALLLARAPDSVPDGYGTFAVPEVRARWLVPGRGWRTGEVIASPGAAAGSTVRVWVDRSGTISGPPLRGGQVVGQVVLAAVLAPTALLLLLGCVWAIARRSLDKRRLAAWEAGWQAAGPRWSSLR